MSERTDTAPVVRYRCRACGREFVPALPGVAPCPRCQAISGHRTVAMIPPGGAASDE